MMKKERDTLYREEVLAYKLLGPKSTPVIAQKSYLKIQLWLWSALLIAAFYLLMQAQYKETLPARGVLLPTMGTQKILSPATAMVKQIYVQRGDHVEKGQILASLSTDLFDLDGETHQLDTINQLQSQKDLLLLQKEVLQDINKNSRQRYREVRENLHIYEQNIEKEADLLSARLEISQRNLTAIGDLFTSGNASASHYDQQKVRHLDLLSELERVEQRRQQSIHELKIVTNDEQVEALDKENSELSFQREIQSIDQQIDQLRKKNNLTLLAENEGVVAEIGIESGRSVLLNQPVFYINPIEYELQAAIYVPAAVHGKLTAGQVLMLRFDAFDYRIFGRYDATVSSIGQARIDPRDSLLPIAGINEPVFKVMANLEQAYVEGPDIYKLQSGMTLVADFVVSEMSLIEFILKPILKLKGKVS